MTNRTDVRKVFMLLAFILLICPLSGYGIGEPYEERIRFEKDQQFSEPDHIMFGAITASAVDLAGRVFMGDNDLKMIHVFDTSGKYLDSFGSQGNGPGEFQMISQVAADQNRIHVFDMIQGRINLFDAQTFAFSGDVSLAENGQGPGSGGMDRPMAFHLLTDGSYLVVYRNLMIPDEQRTAIISPAGEVIEKDRFAFRQDKNERVESTSGNVRVVANFPFHRSSRLTVSPNGLIGFNWNEKLEFDFFDESGKPVRSFSHPFDNARLDRRDVLEMMENSQGQRVVMGSGAGGGVPPIQQMVQQMELPETWPAVSSIFADQKNRLWVSAFTEKSAERKWFLFNEQGALLGVFNWASGKSVVHADGDRVYVLERDPEEFDRVVRYTMK